MVDMTATRHERNGRRWGQVCLLAGLGLWGSWGCSDTPVQVGGGGSGPPGSGGMGGVRDTGGSGASVTGGAGAGGSPSSGGEIGTGGALGAGGSVMGGMSGLATASTGASRRLDLLFMVDDSPGMAPLQKQLTVNLADFMHVLEDPEQGGLPDIHIGVISSDLGAGRSIVPGCQRQAGDQGMFFNASRNPVGCATPKDKYIIDSILSDGTRGTNFTGDITDVFSCIALLGQNGCGFESQFGSILTALATPPPPGNEGFLRDDAVLGVVLLTNEDDCTALPNSDLFDPNMTDPARDPYGALASYRCTEFGLTCDQAMPHLAPATPATLTNCRSKEDGRLLKVSDFVAGLKVTKSDPSRIVFAAIAAPVTPTPGGTGATLTVSATQVGGVAAPLLNHAPGCESYAGDAAVRIAAATQMLGGTFASICQDNYATAFKTIATGINAKLGNALCLPKPLATDASGQLSCRVVERQIMGGVWKDTPVHACATDPSLPCWAPAEGGGCAPGFQQLFVKHAEPSAPLATEATCDRCLPGSTLPGCLP